MNFTANQCDFHWEPFNFPCFLSFGKLSWFDFATLGRIAFRNKHGMWVYSDRVKLHKVAWFVTTYNHGLQNTILNIFAIFIIFYEILTILHDFNSSYKFEIFDNFLILYHFLTILKVLTFLAKFWQFWTLMTIWTIFSNSDNFFYINFFTVYETFLQFVTIFVNYWIFSFQLHYFENFIFFYHFFTDEIE